MNTNKNFVSLGSSCCIALSLKELNLKKHSFPFDWNPNVLKIVIDCLNTKFEYYKKLGNYEIKDNFNEELYKFKNIISPTFDINYVNYYCNWFPHDLNLSTQELNNQISRRCERFLNLLNSNNEIIFIYTNEEAIFIKEYKDNQINYYQDLINIQNIIIDKFNKTNFKIIYFFLCDLKYDFTNIFKNTEYINCYPIMWSEFSDNGENIKLNNIFRNIITNKLSLIL